MKKIIRIASVIALASASLLYVGCTKDFSADIAKTNQDVAALSQKVESLNSTVQTINGTVESLKTTKADLSKVEELDAAIKSALEKEISELEASLTETAGKATQAAADAAAAKTDAATAQAAADAVAADLEKTNANLDTVIADVKNVADSLDIVAANLASVSEDVETLRADVDSLQNWQGEIISAINTLTGKVEALAVRITSIVAVPSEYYEFQRFSIDTLGNEAALDTNIFKATFVVAPASAVADLNAANFKVYLKEGLTRGNATPVDTVLAVKKIVKNETNGTVTVFAGIKEFPTTAPESNKDIYYSLAYNGEDGAGEYSEYSEFVKAHKYENVLKLEDIITVQDRATAKEITEAKSYVDTIAYNEAKNTVYNTAFNGRCDVVAKLNGELINLEEFARIIGTQAKKLAIDTVCTTVDSILTTHNNGTLYSAKNPYPWPGEYFNSTEDGYPEFLFWFPAGIESAKGNGIEKKSDGVFVKAKTTDSHYFGNKTTVMSEIKVSGETIGYAITDTLYIGGKNLGNTDLGKSSVEWYYDYAKTGIDEEFKINNKTAAENLRNKDTLISGFFTLTKVDANYVKVAAKGAKYAKVAADTTYNVDWATKYNIGVKSDSTFAAFKWAFKAGPRPADPEAIKFAADTIIIGKKVINVEFKGVYEASIAAIDELDNRSVIDAPKAVSVDGVKVSEKTYKGPKVTFSWTDEKTVKAEIDKAEAGKTYVIVAEANCAGITFTYEFTVTVVSAATPKLKALSAYVKEEGGKYSIEIAAPEPSKARYADRNYVANLNEIVFSHYFVIDTTDAKLAGLKVEFKSLDTTSTGALELNSVDAKDYVAFEDTPSTWEYDSTFANVVAYLINGQDTIDNAAIKFWTKEPIKSVAHVDSTVKHNNAKGDKINLDGLFTMKDYLDSTVWKNGAEVTGRGYYDYDIDIEYLADSTWTISGGTLPEGAVHMDDGKTLVLDAQSAEIVNPITVEVPFVVKHSLDRFGKAADDRQGSVKVTFTSEK